MDKNLNPHQRSTDFFGGLLPTHDRTWKGGENNDGGKMFSPMHMNQFAVCTRKGKGLVP